MKQYLNSNQTAKLIELGFEKPKNERWVLDVANESTPSIQNIVKRQDYSIGELIEMLPHSMAFSDGDWNLCIDVDIYGEELAWQVGFIGEFFVKDKELIDALYDMIIKLKEEEVI